MYIPERNVVVPRERLENLQFQLRRLSGMSGDLIEEVGDLIAGQAETPPAVRTAPLQVPSGHRRAASREPSRHRAASQDPFRRLRESHRATRDDDRRSRSRRRSSVRTAGVELDVAGVRHTPGVPFHVPLPPGATAKASTPQPLRPTEEGQCHYFGKQGFDSTCLERASHMLVMLKASPKYRWACANCGAWQVESGVAEWHKEP